MRIANHCPENCEVRNRVVTHRRARWQWDDVRKQSIPIAGRAAESHYMLNYKPISVESARVHYFQALGEVSATEGQRQADQARENHRKATLILQNAHRMDRNRKLSIKRAQK